MVKNSEISSASSQTSLLQDPTITCVKKSFFFKNLVLVLRASFLAKFHQMYQNLTNQQLSLQNLANATRPARGTLVQKKSLACIRNCNFGAFMVKTLFGTFRG